MPYVAVADKAAGSILTEADWDTFIRDNLNKGVLRPVAEVTLVGSQASIDFSSIAADWSHLLIKAYLRGDTAAVAQTVLCRLNNDSGANYDYQSLSGVAAGTAAGETFGATSVRIGTMPAATATANVFGSLSAELAHYTNAANHKALHSRSATKSGVASGDLSIANFACFWRSIAAVNRITLLPGAGNFVTGSRVTLYGAGGI